MKIIKNDCIMIGDSYTSYIQGGTKMEIKSILVRSENKNNYRNLAIIVLLNNIDRIV
jgi:ribonucleotide monophosphatase NagD (HAD superfamily)